ncbi:MAG TPA: flagellar hook-basal body complex protein FliE [Bryobacteraceae bacterium]|nr:flagellar hook-basal body complex protein FliE [Bryobacteraceae bacterium]
MNIPFGAIPSTITGLTGNTSGGITGAGAPTSFADAFAGAIDQVEGAQSSAKSAAMDLLAGGKGDVHTVALVAQRAELSLELFQQVRNKFVSAYQEIMKMPM